MKKLFQILAGFLFIVFVIGYCTSNSETTSNSNENVVETTNTQVQAKPKIEIISQNFIASDVNPRIVVEIKNNSNKTASYIQLKSIFYDADNKIIGTGIGNAVDVNSGQTKTIDILTIDNLDNAKQFKVELDNVLW